MELQIKQKQVNTTGPSDHDLALLAPLERGNSSDSPAHTNAEQTGMEIDHQNDNGIVWIDLEECCDCNIAALPSTTLEMNLDNDLGFWTLEENIGQKRRVYRKEESIKYVKGVSQYAYPSKKQRTESEVIQAHGEVEEVQDYVAIMDALEVAVEQNCELYEDLVGCRPSFDTMRLDNIVKQALKCKKPLAGVRQIAKWLKQNDNITFPVTEFNFVSIPDEVLIEQLEQLITVRQYWNNRMYSSVKNLSFLVSYCNSFLTYGDKLTIRQLPNRIQAQAGVEENTITQEENTTFTDQREQVADTGYVTNQTEPNMQPVSMQENEWHIRNVMSKPLVAFSIPWSTSDEPGKQLISRIVPGDFMLGPHYNLAATFVFFRGHPRLRFQINSNKFNFGRLIVAFVPQYTLDQYTDYLYTTDNLTSMPHVILDASVSNTGILDIPFVHMCTYFNSVITRPYDFLGNIVISVFNRLGSTTGASQTVDVTCWVSYDNCELHIPCNAHDLTFVKSKKISAHAGVEGLVKSVLPAITDLVAPSATTTVGSLLGGASNCDKPTDPQEISRWVPNTVTSLNFGEGLDRSNRLSLKPGTETLGDADLVSTTKDDMNLKLIMQIPTRLTTFKWTTANGPTTLLRTLPVYPTSVVKVYRDDTVDPKVDIWEAPLLAYCSRAYKYWRGGLRWKIQIIGNLMMSGRLQISFVAGFGSEDFNVCNYLNTYIVDIQEQHEIEFVTPFISERPWLRCDKLASIEQNADQHIAEVSTGQLVFHVLNRLTVPDSSAQTIDINVLVSAAEDFEVAFPTDLAIYRGSGSVIPKIYAHALVATEAVTSREDSGSHTLTKGGGTLSSAAASTMSENGMDLKTVLRRYYKVYDNIIDATEDVFLCFANTPCLSGVVGGFAENGHQYRTTLCHFSELFTFWRGSLRYKLIFSMESENTSTKIEVFHIPGVFLPTAFRPRSTTKLFQAVLGSMEAVGVMVASTQIQNSMEFEIPFYTPFTQLRTWQAGADNSYNATGTVFIRIHGQDRLRMALYQAAADGFSLNYLRAAPRIQMQQDSEKNRTIGNTAQWLYETSYMPIPPFVEDSPSAPEEEEEPTGPIMAHIGMPRNPYTETMNAVNSFQQTATSVQQTADRLTELVEGISTRVGIRDVTGDAEEESDDDDPDGLFSSLDGFLKSLPSLTGSAISLGATAAVVVTGFQAYLTADTTFLKGCAIVTIVKELLGKFISTIKINLSNLATTIIGFFDNSDKQGNQSLVEAHADIVSFVPALVAVLTTGLIVLGFKNIPNDKDTQKLVDHISGKMRLFNFTATALSNVKSLFTQMKELTEWITDQILMLVAPQLLAQLKLERGFEDITNFTSFIDNIGTNYIDRCNADPDFRNQLLKWCEKGEYYIGLLAQGKIGREAAIIREYARRAIEIREEVVKAYTMLESRIDPLCVCMTGETNVGKSFCIQALGNHLMTELGYPIRNRWCSINPTEQYFNESYNHQAAVYIDDFAMFTKEEQFMNFCNLKANTKTPLNMAFKKGLHFYSDFIFMTTNHAYPKPNFMMDVSAFYRRRDILIEARFKDDETREKVNNGEYNVRDDEMGHARFRILDSRAENGPKGEWLTFEKLKEAVYNITVPYMENQRRIVRKTLIDNGYIVDIPLTEAHGEEDEFELARTVKDGDRVLNFGKVYEIPDLQVWDISMYEALEWDSNIGKFVLKEGVTDPLILNDYTSFDKLRTAQQTQSNLCQLIHGQPMVISKLDRHLVGCSEIFNSKKPALRQRLQDALCKIGKLIKDTWESAKKKMPWLKCLSTWPAKLAGAVLALIGVGGVIKKIAHKCYCSSVRYMGYRCTFCGRWPNLESCLNKEWILQEWQSFYGATEDYKERVTSLEEERSKARFDGDVEPERCWVGTRKKIEAQLGPYSDVTKGAALSRVVANTGPYSDLTKGAALNRVIANAGQKTLEVLDNRIIKALYRIRVGKLSFLSMNALAIGGRWILVQQHLMDIATKLGGFSLYHSNSWLEVLYEKERVVSFPGKDLVLYELPVQFHQHKDLRSHFISEADLPKLKRTQAILATQDSKLRTQLQNVEAQANDRVEYELKYNGKSEPYYVRTAWKYRGMVGAGMCGSVLMTTDDRVSGSILGVHVAGIPGSPGVGYSTVITREMLNVTMSGRLGTPLPKAHAGISKIIPNGHFGWGGIVEKGVYQSSRTSIIPTPIQGMITPVKTAPAALTSNDPRITVKINLIRKCIEKYGTSPVPFNIDDRRIYREGVKEEMRNWKVQRTPEVLKPDEAVFGLEGLEGFDRLPLATSPGWPWVLTRGPGIAGKAYLFDLERNTIINKELEQKLEQRHEMAKRGERVESVWTCCLKDERRPLEKIAAGKTRMFVIPPVDYSILHRMYFLDYCVAIKDNRATSHNKVGIDPQSLEWTQLYDYLAGFSCYGFAGDFSCYDGTCAPDLQCDFVESGNDFCELHGQKSEEANRVRRVLADEGIHTPLLAGKELIMKHTGNNSGSPDTEYKNSYVNDEMMCLAFLDLARKNKVEATFANYRKKVRVATYGDDNIVVCKEDVLGWYNQETVSEWLFEYGIVYTNAEKTGITKFQRVDTMTFLKQGFGLHCSIPNIRVPLMAKDTIHELLNWTRIAPDQDVLLEDNCNDALRFAYFYGPQYFNALRTKILKALEVIGKPLTIKTYTDFHYWFLFVCGMLPNMRCAQGMFESISRSGNSRFSRTFSKIFEAAPYKLLSMMGLLYAEDSRERTDSRYAIAIPSGEGKTWLCKSYPNIFYDHDDILLPEASRRLKEKGLDWDHLWKMTEVDLPKEDRRILLVHHPNNTSRQMLGSYVLPKPCYVRANAYQRLRLRGAKRMEREERNEEILDLARKMEPQLF